MNNGDHTMEFELTASKTYATKDNVRKAVAKLGLQDLRYFIFCTEGTQRFFPVFVGQDALRRGAHFHFSVVG